MTYKYKKDSFLRNKVSGAAVKIFVDTNKIDENIWEIWTPKQGELCWFWNNGDKYPTLSKLESFTDYGDDLMCIYAETPWYYELDEFDGYSVEKRYTYDFCSPITNELPLELGLINKCAL
jgi:hypothetical protein